MPQFGLGNFVYELDVKDGKANFSFRDPWDAENHAEVTIDQSEFDGFAADSRQVADKAYDKCQRVLNEKRDARIKKEAEDQLDAQQKEDARARQSAQDFLESTSDVAVAPAKTEKDGTNVYNTENVAEAVKTDADDSKKKK